MGRTDCVKIIQKMKLLLYGMVYENKTIWRRLNIVLKMKLPDYEQVGFLCDMFIVQNLGVFIL